MLAALTAHRQVAVVSCDIEGHSAEDSDMQVDRVRKINRAVAETIVVLGHEAVTWSSGGDGGHVVFREHDWHGGAIQLIRKLRRWALADSVPLRITAHYGAVTEIKGADGRVQPVGDAINFAGWLLSQVTSEGVVVSAEFRREIESGDAGVEVHFEGPRLFPHRDLPPQLLYLMALDGMPSQWGGQRQDDRLALLGGGDGEVDGWGIVYYAKRIWQVNSGDKLAAAAMVKVSEKIKQASPDSQSMFGYLRPGQLNELVRLGQLVERKSGESICKFDDPGDSLFLILRGQVGVYNFEAEGYGPRAIPRHVQVAGQIVGELAYALGRNRTADLIALTDVALLSFNNDDIRQHLSKSERGGLAARMLESFVNERVLEHVAQSASYLVGPNRTGPLSSVEVMDAGPDDRNAAWRDALRVLEPHTEVLTVPRGAVDLDVVTLSRTMADQSGLYILASGEVRATTVQDRVLRGVDFPVLWVDLPGLISLQPSLYEVVREAAALKVLRIGSDGIKSLTVPQRTKLRTALQDVVGRKPDEFEFDVYLCHTKRDEPLIREIYDRLTAADVRCWYDDVEMAPGDLVTEKIELGLRSSRYVMACASANFRRSRWAQREFGTVLHLDVKRRGKPRALVLMLNDDEDKDDAIPLLARDIKRLNYERGGHFEELVSLLRGHRAPEV